MDFMMQAPTRAWQAMRPGMLPFYSVFVIHQLVSEALRTTAGRICHARARPLEA